MKASARQLRTGKPAADKARLLALDLLGQWNNTGLDREELLNACLPRDRALVKNLVSGTLRMRGLIDYYLDHFLKTGKGALPGRVLDILRLAVFQLRFCDRIPDYAVVNEAVELARPLYLGRYVPLVNAVLRGFLREGGKIALPRREDYPAHFLAVKHSHPRWLVGRYLKRFGFEGTESLLKANNVQAPLTVRVRSPETVRAFREAGLETRKGAWAPEALAVGRRLVPSRLPGYGQGLFYVQDEAQMLVGRLAAPQPGATVADLCAAPGGKATHLAELAGPDALVVAADTGAGGLEKLRENLDRLRLSCVRLVAADARRPAVRRADTVLCDVPCSGSGVLRRKPELRWRIQPQSLKRFTRLQREIISAACRCVAPGGVLVYSTCSLEPEENSQVIDWFLASTADFVLEHAQKYLGQAPVSERGFLETFPHLHGTDGVFAARLRRKEGARAGK
ncbi:MAG: 16S rRNA (cytosine(967)-C(5))-methyltransferase RsmB [Candidatus Glassbacteria bacterium]|nr:16S rRNA (cytosine(967)-C(5))-methyltransferase RsmB [Candidatus Glassbacteria bacterium]